MQTGLIIGATVGSEIPESKDDVRGFEELWEFWGLLGLAAFMIRRGFLSANLFEAVKWQFMTSCNRVHFFEINPKP